MEVVPVSSGPTSAFPILCDLDGVVWLATQPIVGAAQAIGDLRSAGHRVVFVTNNSFARVTGLEEQLASIGIPARGDVMTSSMATASLLPAGAKVLVCGGPGLIEAVETRGAHVVAHDVEAVDVVVVGLHKNFDYEGLRRAATAIRRGATFIASNEDPTYPTPDGPIPGGGSIVAAIAAASGQRPIVAGKPHQAMADLVRSNVEGVDSRAVMIGDRSSTDGRFAARLGCRFALVTSDVSAETSEVGVGAESGPDFRGHSLRDVASLLLRT